MHLSHQSYLITGLTANTNRSDSYFDGDEFDEFHEMTEKYHERPLYPVSPHLAPEGMNCLFPTCFEVQRRCSYYQQIPTCPHPVADLPASLRAGILAMVKAARS